MNTIIQKYYIESLEFEHENICLLDRISIYETCLDSQEKDDYVYESVF